MVKRLLDIAVSLVLILLLAAPMLIIALLIRLGSPGPAIFRQRRVGRHGHPFVMLKFRTMEASADTHGVSPHSADDPRLTRIGRLLREHSLDEWPQLFNILLGQMSLIGPRPLYERQAELWDDRQRRRLDVRPGITGWAQVQGRGEIPIEDKIEFDLYYVEHQSLWLDLKIVWKTVTGGGGIYEQRYSRDKVRETGGHLLGIVFDLDDTLYLERDYVRSGYRAVAEHLRETLSRDEPFEDWLWQRFQTGQSSGAFDAMSEHFQLDLSPEHIANLVDVYRRHRPDIKPIDGVPAMLTELQDRARLCLLSDGFLPAQQLKLDALGLGDRFEQIVFTEELGRDAWKPSPTGFELLQNRLDLPPESLAYVSDNPRKDFVAPNRLGWRTIQFRCQGQVHSANPDAEDGSPQVVVDSVAQLRAVLLDML